MNHEGYIKLYRSSLDTEVFQNEVAWKIWCWCLLKATHQEYTVLIGRQSVDLKPGQFVFGGKKASESLGFAVSTIWYWLTFFQKRGQAELKKTNKYSIVTITNWHEYQEAELKKNSKRTQKEPYKNIKNIKNTDNANSAEPLSPSFSLSAYLEKMSNDKQRHIQLIGRYLTKRGVQFESEGEVRVAIRRHLRAAKQLAEFTDPRIKEAVKIAEEKHNDIDWTLETLVKILTK